MSKGVVSIATTLDGYIARKDGGLDRLNDLPNPDKLDYGYADFVSSVDTIIMGKNTYMDILGFDVERPYKDCSTYVVTHEPDLEVKTPNSYRINGLAPETIKKIQDKAQKNIWILGGGNIISQCLDLGIIDEMILTLVPIILGAGIPLFPNAPDETSFSLVKTESFPTGVVMLHYKKAA